MMTPHRTRTRTRARVTWLAAALALSACGETSRLPPSADVGPRPTLAPPQTSWLPTVHIAPAIGWPAGRTPVAAPGLRVTAFAEGLDHPRWLHVLPNGDVLVADYLTAVRNGGFYGWPYSGYGQHVDRRVQPQRPDLVAAAIPPDYALGAHVAALGLADSSGSALPAPMGAGSQGMFVAMHGSWNRRPLAGYKVVFIPFTQGRPQGRPIDVLTGFVDADGRALGRPVGVAVDARGGLLVADDVGNKVWRVTAQ